MYDVAWIEVPWWRHPFDEAEARASEGPRGFRTAPDVAAVALERARVARHGVHTGMLLAREQAS